jgi:hypothetical protein
MLKPFITSETVEVNDKTKLNLSIGKLPHVDDEDKQADEIGISAATIRLGKESDVDDYENDSETPISISLGEESSQIKMPNVEQTETWKNIKINPDLRKSVMEKLWDFVEEYGDKFSDAPTPTNLVIYDIKLQFHELVRHKPYKIPVH